MCGPVFTGTFVTSCNSYYINALATDYRMDSGKLLFLLLKIKINNMGNFGWQEILLIAVVILILFGARKIPEFMKGLGRGMREFNDAKNNVKNELEEGMNEKDQQVKSSVNTAPQEPTTKS